MLGIGSKTIKTDVIDAFDLWWPDDAKQRTMWPSTVQLAPRYFDSLTKHAVPLDSRAVAALAHSALDLDIYAWLAQRLHRIPKGKPQTITWQALKSQFGPEYDRLREFRREVRAGAQDRPDGLPQRPDRGSRCRLGAVEFPASGSEEAGQHAAPQPPDHRRDRDRDPDT